jgi:hypothetical protein
MRLITRKMTPVLRGVDGQTTRKHDVFCGYLIRREGTHAATSVDSSNVGRNAIANDGALGSSRCATLF